MPTLYLPVKFIQRCQRYLDSNPRVADDVADFISRCGRLGLWYLDRLLTEEEKRDCVFDPNSPNRRGRNRFFIDKDGNIDNRKYKGEKIPIYIPDKDYERVEQLVVKKLGITTTVISWYILCVFMVIAGYWELPPKI